MNYYFNSLRKIDYSLYTIAQALRLIKFNYKKNINI